MSGQRAVRLLPPQLANQIAAGEVVERPASVVKELLENALDAGARRIRVESERGGTVRVCVTDDGCGMGPDDARLAVRRHATSKIASVEDLRTIATFGFRGEALPSIAAVSRLTLTTRREADAAAVRLDIEGGGDAEERDAAAPAGTCVDVRDLFFNVPARRKFLRRVPTEASRLLDVCAQLALARPDVGLAVVEDGRTRLDAPRVRTHADRAAAVLGLKTATELTPVDRVGSSVRVHGLVGPPALTRSNAAGLYTFVNGRYVRDTAVRGAILGAYRGLLDRGRFPIAVLFIEVDPSEVDVNVHPAKHEVRFAALQAVTGSVVEAVRSVLAGSPWVGHRGQAGTAPPPGQASERVVRLTPTPTAAAPAPFAEAAARFRSALDRRRRADGEVAAPAPGLQASLGGEPGRGAWFSSLSVLGTAGGCYVVCEGREGLVVIDQHAAHERVTFERLRGGLSAGRVPVQPFLVPVKVDLSPRQLHALETDADYLARLGLETEPFGGASVLLKTVPAPLVGRDGAALLTEVLDDLASGEVPSPVGGAEALTTRLDAIAASLACHGSVRAGQPLSPEEVRALLAAMDRIDFAGNCPHGRPTVVEIPFAELERRFRRA